MFKQPKPKGEYHYAIKALTSRLEKIVKKRNTIKDADERIKSIRAALEVLRVNNLPAAPKTLGELYDEEEQRRGSQSDA